MVRTGREKEIDIRNLTNEYRRAIIVNGCG